MKFKYYKCENCGNLQVETEFGECFECSYEDLIEITEEEYLQLECKENIKYNEIENNIKIMVVGYNEHGENETVLDFVNTHEEAEAKDDFYHNSFRYTDFIECIYEDGIYIFEEVEYKIGDRLI